MTARLIVLVRRSPFAVRRSSFAVRRSSFVGALGPGAFD
jgi:hypothetical protein